MTRSEFRTRLDERGVNAGAVVFDDPVKEGYVVRKVYSRWEVCLRERGREFDCVGFPSESDALQYLFDKLCP